MQFIECIEGAAQVVGSAGDFLHLHLTQQSLLELGNPVLVGSMVIQQSPDLSPSPY